MSGDTRYNLYLDIGNKRVPTNDSPHFVVEIGRRDKVVYRDDFNTIQLGATLGRLRLDVGTHFLMKRIRTVPPESSRENYATEVLARIREAAEFEGLDVTFSGPVT